MSIDDVTAAGTEWLDLEAEPLADPDPKQLKEPAMCDSFHSNEGKEANLRTAHPGL